MRELEQRSIDEMREVKGEVVIAITANGRGDVVSAKAVRSTLGDPGMVACILESFRAIQFSDANPPLEAGVTLTFELVPPPLQRD